MTTSPSCRPARRSALAIFKSGPRAVLQARGGMAKPKRARKFSAARSEAQDETARWLAEAERRARRSK